MKGNIVFLQFKESKKYSILDLCVIIFSFQKLYISQTNK